MTNLNVAPKPTIIHKTEINSSNIFVNETITDNPFSSSSIPILYVGSDSFNFESKNYQQGAVSIKTLSYSNQQGAC
jgi:hypothetical protein